MRAYYWAGLTWTSYGVAALHGRAPLPVCLCGPICCGMCMQMRDYCLDEKGCRHALLLAYFGERFAPVRCRDRCDTCLKEAGADTRADSVWKVGTAHRARLKPGMPHHYLEAMLTKVEVQN